MRCLLPFLAWAALSIAPAWSQGMQAYKDRDEELALQRARALKELKNSIGGPSAPAPPRIMVSATGASGYSASAYEASVPRPGEGGVRFEQMKREPLRLSVMTPTGLVPLATYQDPSWQAEMATRQSEAQRGGVGRRMESQIKAWRISLFDRTGQGGDISDATRAVPLAEGQGGEPGAEVIAIVEETPAQVEGGEPERKILGFLPAGREPGARVGRPMDLRGLAGRNREQATAPGEPGEASAPGVGRDGEAPGPEEEAFTMDDVISRPPERERALLARWFNRGGGEGDVLVQGEEVALMPATPERQRNFMEKWFDRMDGTVGGSRSTSYEVPSNQPRRERTSDYSGLEGAEYLATATMQAPFHVIDSGPGETYVIELAKGTVGRAHGSGDQWAWLQLDSGLMGLIRKQHLRAAEGGEVDSFLVAERSQAGGSGPVPVSRKRETPQAVGGSVASDPEGRPDPGTMIEPAPTAAPGSDAPLPTGIMTPGAEPEKKKKDYPDALEKLLNSLE